MKPRTLIAALFAAAALTTPQNTDAQYCRPGYIPDRFFYGRQPVYYPYNPYSSQIIVRYSTGCRSYTPVWERAERQHEKTRSSRRSRQHDRLTDLKPGKVYLIDGNLVEVNKDPKTGKISTSVIPLNQAAPETVWVPVPEKDYRRDENEPTRKEKSVGEDDAQPRVIKEQRADTTHAAPDSSQYKMELQERQKTPADTTKADSLSYSTGRRQDEGNIQSRSDSVLTTMQADSSRCYSCHSAEILRNMRVVPGTKGKEDDNTDSKERKTKKPQARTDTLRTGTYPDSLKIMERELDEYLDKEFEKFDPEAKDLVHKRFEPYLKKKPHEWERMRDPEQRTDAFEDYLFSLEKDGSLMKQLLSR